jgi:two-component system cell cycle sensor histidine kinase/response regulator CckA
MNAESKASILIVEDDEGVAVLERRALERRGFAVTGVSTGADALAVIRDRPIDLVVMDYRLADGTTGLDLLGKLKTLGYDLPVVMVTGFSNESTAIEALRQGVRDFVPKTTYYLDYLPDAVERVLNAAHMERQLTQSEARFQSFMDNSPAIAFVKDADGRLLYANRRFAEECGQPCWQGKTDDELWPMETARQLRALDAATLAAGQPQQATETLTTRNGATHHWLTCRFPLKGSQGERLIGGMAVDVTQQKEAEEALRVRDEQLRQAQKMEAIGQLAGGVAHDFNNLLTIILGYSDVLANAPDQPKQRVEMLAEIHNAAERAGHLTRQLLAFSRKQVLEPRVVNLNDIVGNMEKMLRRLIGEDVSIHTTLAPDLDRVLADPGQLEQVIMNLVVNARDAMPQGGELCIETANIELDLTYAKAHADVNPGRYTVLAISDSGCGMDEATKARIFEPFFTTKQIGKGTGLGLATVYGIVRQSGGHICVSSGLGHGTTFKVYFPAVVRSEPAPKPSSDRNLSLSGNETILIVEDEDSVRALVHSILEIYGYTVLEAREPFEAVQLSESYAGPIHLLLTDVIMPQLNGKRLSELLQSQRPSMKVLFMSGYTDDAIVRQGILSPGICFVQKPFTPAVLAAKLRDALASVSPGLGSPQSAPGLLPQP